MKRFTALITLFSILVLFVGCDTYGSSKETDTGITEATVSTSNSSDVEFLGSDRTLYSMDCVLDPAEKTLSLTEVVTFTNTSDTVWDKVCFRNYAEACLQSGVGGIYVDENGDPIDPFADETPKVWYFVQDEYTCGITEVTDPETSKPLSYYTDGDDKTSVFVELGTSLAPGESTAICIEFFTDIAECGERFGVTQMTKKYDTWGDPYTENDMYTFQICNFYPILCEWENGDFVRHPYIISPECFYSECADYDVTLSLPEEYTVVSSGTENLLGTSNGISEYRMTAENMRDFAIVASNEYAAVPLESEVCGIKVRCLAPDNREGFKNQRELCFEAACDAVEAFTNAYGDMPYKEVDVCITGYANGGMEYPGLVVIRDSEAYNITEEVLAGTVLPEDFEEIKADAISGTQANTAHEIAHQWFYAVVGNDEYSYPFIDESFAAFSELVYNMHTGSSAEDIANEMYKFENDGGQFAANSDKWPVDASCGSEQFDTKGVYRQGKIFLYKLMCTLGEETFFDMMKEWYSSNTFEFATTEEFLEHIVTYAEGNDQIQVLIDRYFFAEK